MKSAAIAILFSLLVTSCSTVHRSFVGQYLPTATERKERLILESDGLFWYNLGDPRETQFAGTWEATSSFVILEFLRFHDPRDIVVLEVTRVHGIRHLTLVAPDSHHAIQTRIFAETPNFPEPAQSAVH